MNTHHQGEYNVANEWPPSQVFPIVQSDRFEREFIRIPCRLMDSNNAHEIPSDGSLEPFDFTILGHEENSKEPSEKERYSWLALFWEYPFPSEDGVSFPPESYGPNGSVTQLCNIGYMYSTVDEEHFKHTISDFTPYSERITRFGAIYLSYKQYRSAVLSILINILQEASIPIGDLINIISEYSFIMPNLLFKHYTLFSPLAEHFIEKHSTPKNNRKRRRLDFHPNSSWF